MLIAADELKRLPRNRPWRRGGTRVEAGEVAPLTLADVFQASLSEGAQKGAAKVDCVIFEYF